MLAEVFDAIHMYSACFPNLLRANGHVSTPLEGCSARKAGKEQKPEFKRQRDAPFAEGIKQEYEVRTVVRSGSRQTTQLSNLL